MMASSRRSSLLFFLLVLICCLASVANGRNHKRRHADADENRTRRRKFSSEIRIVQPNDNFTFLANESWLHVKTENLLLDHQTCLEYRISLEGKRTRLRAYACRVTEGGQCTMDKFVSTNGKEECYYLTPWMYKKDTYQFHFQFERRPRKFHDLEAELRWRRRRHGRQATRLVGTVRLMGLTKCVNACKDSDY